MRRNEWAFETGEAPRTSQMPMTVPPGLVLPPDMPLAGVAPLIVAALPLVGTVPPLPLAAHPGLATARLSLLGLDLRWRRRLGRELDDDAPVIADLRRLLRASPNCPEIRAWRIAVLDTRFPRNCT